ncbi:2-oxo-hepta-3-ene-1,7-dioate hydratase (plasmid) [Aminobacter sp. Y103A]|uniref:2-keto-4-pentenoate hydratase n=1 Tax=Aminobacter sp. Y103A TaxID=1870862 RepID=UPI00257220BA|nr:fumarylacetoacetate hydrolase family protein [Aminobacter sp. SS-2016]BBD41119.1 2-oxo-hepta-3-ene-1,7-dioate hydratase [Aminobacter sp. SS-2016]
MHKAAEAILRAERSATSMPPLSGDHPDLTLDEAYGIQNLLNDMRKKQGLRFAGYKIGLTWHSTQIACNLTEPIRGRILKDAVFDSGSKIPAARFVKPHIEVELAFVMRRDLDRPGATIDEVLQATDYIVPALELVDHRMAPPRIVADTVADNSAFAAIVLSDRRFRPENIDVRWVGAALSRNGIVEETGVSAIGMGHPAACVAWLANALVDASAYLRKGDIVMSGAFARAVAVAEGDQIEADFGPYGHVKASF